MTINPIKSTNARPGTEEKVLTLSARYTAGLPLWHDDDCNDHGSIELPPMWAALEAHPQPLSHSDAPVGQLGSRPPYYRRRA